MADQILSRLVRTMSTYFRFGTVRLKDSSGVVQFRNAGDTAYADSASKQVRVQGSNATNAVILTAPAALGGSVTFTLPSAVGSTNQVLADIGGDGTLGFIDVSANANLVQELDFTEATSSPATIFAPASNYRLFNIIVDIESAGSASTPSVSVGTVALPTVYMLATESDLLNVGTYEVNTPVELGVGPDPVVLTITPASQTFTGRVYVFYALPS